MVNGKTPATSCGSASTASASRSPKAGSSSAAGASTSPMRPGGCRQGACPQLPRSPLTGAGVSASTRGYECLHMRLMATTSACAAAYPR